MLTLLLFLTTFNIVYSEPEQKLIKVFLISRHGDRSPIETYPNLHNWEHRGHLTGEGMHQLYSIGEQMRKNYIDEVPFLDPVYNPKKLTARSTIKPRTLVSAQSFLQGLYPPGTGPLRASLEEKDFALPFGLQPIPVITESSQNDLLLHAYKHCNKIKVLKKEVRKGEEWLNKEKETEEFRKYLEELLGSEVLLEDVSSVYHAIKAEVVHSKKNKEIVDEVNFNKINEIKDWVLMKKYDTRQMGRLGSGLLLRHIVETFQNYTNSSDTHFTYYSAHDGTLLSLFSAMNMKDLGVPHYAAFIIFELHKSGEEFAVTIKFHNNDPKEPMFQYKFSLNEFFEKMKDGMITEKEYFEECRNQGSNTNGKKDDL